MKGFLLPVGAPATGRRRQAGVRDNPWRQYADLAAYLDGRGVPNIDEALKEVFLQAIHLPFKEVVNAAMFQRLFEAIKSDFAGDGHADLLNDVEWKLVSMLEATRQFIGGKAEIALLAREVRREIQAILFLTGDSNLAERLQAIAAGDRAFWGGLFGWAFVHALGRVAGPVGAAERSRSWLDEWLLGRILGRVLHDFGLDSGPAERTVQIIRLLTTHQRWFEVEMTDELPAYHVVEAIFKDGDAQQFLGMNRFQDVLWYTGQAFDELLDNLLAIAVVQESAAVGGPALVTSQEMPRPYEIIRDLYQANRRAEHRAEKLLDITRGEVEAPSATTDG